MIKLIIFAIWIKKKYFYANLLEFKKYLIRRKNFYFQYISFLELIYHNYLA